MTPQIIHKIIIYQIIFIFLKKKKKTKNIEIKNFEPRKWAKPTFVWKYLSTPRNKQCGSWSDGFITNQLIWIYGVFKKKKNKS